VRIPLKTFGDNGVALSDLACLYVEFGADIGNKPGHEIFIAKPRFIKGKETAYLTDISSSARIHISGDVKLNWNYKDEYGNAAFLSDVVMSDESLPIYGRSSVGMDENGDVVMNRFFIKEDERGNRYFRTWSLWPGTTYMEVRRPNGQLYYRVYLEGRYEDNYVHNWKEIDFFDFQEMPLFAIYAEGSNEAEIKWLYQYKILDDGTIIWRHDPGTGEEIISRYDRKGICRWEKKVKPHAPLHVDRIHLYDRKGIEIKNGKDLLVALARRVYRSKWAPSKGLNPPANWGKMTQDVTTLLSENKEEVSNIIAGIKKLSNTPKESKLIGMLKTSRRISLATLTISLILLTGAVLSSFRKARKPIAARRIPVAGAGSPAKEPEEGVLESVPFQQESLEQAIKGFYEELGLEPYSRVIENALGRISRGQLPLRTNASGEYQVKVPLLNRKDEKYAYQWISLKEYIWRDIFCLLAKHDLGKYDKNIGKTSELAGNNRFIMELVRRAVGLQASLGAEGRSDREIAQRISTGVKNCMLLWHNAQMQALGDIKGKKTSRADTLKFEEFLEFSATYDRLIANQENLPGNIGTYLEINPSEQTWKGSMEDKDFLKGFIKEVVDFVNVNQPTKWQKIKNLLRSALSSEVKGPSTIAGRFFWLSLLFAWLSYNFFTGSAWLIGVFPYAGGISTAGITALLGGLTYLVVAALPVIIFMLLSWYSLGYAERAVISKTIGAATGVATIKNSAGFKNASSLLLSKYTERNGKSIRILKELLENFTDEIKRLHKDYYLTDDEYEKIMVPLEDLNTDTIRSITEYNEIKELIKKINGKVLSKIEDPEADEILKGLFNGYLRKVAIPGVKSWEELRSIWIRFIWKGDKFYYFWSDLNEIQSGGRTILYQVKQGYENQWKNLLERLKKSKKINAKVYEQLINLAPATSLSDDYLDKDARNEIENFCNGRMQQVWQTLGGCREIEKAYQWEAGKQKPSLTEEEAANEARKKFQTVVGLAKGEKIIGKYKKFIKGLLNSDEVGSNPNLYNKILQVSKVDITDPDQFAAISDDVRGSLWDTVKDLKVVREMEFGDRDSALCIIYMIQHHMDMIRDDGDASWIKQGQGSYKGVILNKILPYVRGDMALFMDADTGVRMLDARRLLGALTEFDDPNLGIIQFSQYISNARYSTGAGLTKEAIGSFWRNELRAKGGIGFVGFYGHNGLLRTEFLRNLEGPQSDYVSEDLMIALLFRYHGADVMHRDYLELGEGIENTLGQYTFPTTRKWSQGTMEILLGRGYKNFFWSGGIPLTEKLDARYGIGFYKDMNRLAPYGIVLFTLSAILLGINAFSILPALMGIVGMLMSVSINLVMIVYLWEKMGLLKGIGNFTANFPKRFLFWTPLIPNQATGVEIGLAEKAEYITSRKGHGLWHDSALDIYERIIKGAHISFFILPVLIFSFFSLPFSLTMYLMYILYIGVGVSFLFGPYLFNPNMLNRYASLVDALSRTETEPKYQRVGLAFAMAYGKYKLDRLWKLIGALSPAIEAYINTSDVNKKQEIVKHALDKLSKPDLRRLAEKFGISTEKRNKEQLVAECNSAFGTPLMDYLAEIHKGVAQYQRDVMLGKITKGEKLAGTKQDDKNMQAIRVFDRLNWNKIMNIAHPLRVLTLLIDAMVIGAISPYKRLSRLIRVTKKPADNIRAYREALWSRLDKDSKDALLVYLDPEAKKGKYPPQNMEEIKTFAVNLMLDLETISAIDINSGLEKAVKIIDDFRNSLSDDDVSGIGKDIKEIYGSIRLELSEDKIFEDNIKTRREIYSRLEELTRYKAYDKENKKEAPSSVIPDNLDSEYNTAKLWLDKTGKSLNPIKRLVAWSNLREVKKELVKHHSRALAFMIQEYKLWERLNPTADAKEKTKKLKELWESYNMPKRAPPQTWDVVYFKIELLLPALTSLKVPALISRLRNIIKKGFEPSEIEKIEIVKKILKPTKISALATQFDRQLIGARAPGADTTAIKNTLWAEFSPYEKGTLTAAYITEEQAKKAVYKTVDDKNLAGYKAKAEKILTPDRISALATQFNKPLIADNYFNGDKEAALAALEGWQKEYNQALADGRLDPTKVGTDFVTIDRLLNIKVEEGQENATEYLRLINIDGSYTGEIKPRDLCHLAGESQDWHRSVFVAVLDDQGRVLIQTRSTRKAHAPGARDISLGGHMGLDDVPGRDLEETTKEAAAKEFEEELLNKGEGDNQLKGYSVDPERLHVLDKIDSVKGVCEFKATPIGWDNELSTVFVYQATEEDIARIEQVRDKPLKQKKQRKALKQVK
ncbi:MAG: NUDIX domain-containing protein, partial [Candidatus Omnitrophica bacterium]|nr:NUDIX domain-containing protein [Candidatus Omnitrophota bacterium]